MTHYPDLSREAMVAVGEHVRAIGWLQPDHAYTKGEVSAEFLTRLKRFVEQRWPSTEALDFGLMAGIHTCEFCEKVHGLLNIGVPSGEVLYVAPEMIVHYIEQHGYRPPDEFIAAVMASPLPETEEYRQLASPFRELRRKMFS